MERHCLSLFEPIRFAGWPGFQKYSKVYMDVGLVGAIMIGIVHVVMVVALACKMVHFGALAWLPRLNIVVEGVT